MEKIAYGGWPNCVRLTNGTIELVATTDVGPRIIRFGFVGGQNLFKEFAGDSGRTGGDDWRPYGGHRLWHSPEEKPRTYFPDNQRVDCDGDGSSIVLRQATEPTTGIEKQMSVSLEPGRNAVRIVHRLTNRGPWDVTLAPWALTVMAQGGRAVFPQEPFATHTEVLLPARPLVLWPYTDMADPRWTWGTRFIQMRQDPTRLDPQKIGMRNTAGWGLYELNGEIFVKRAAFDPDAEYPDFGCNFEAFTNAEMLEVETLAPLSLLAAGGGSVEHTEYWSLVRDALGGSEDVLAKGLPAILEA